MGSEAMTRSSVEFRDPASFSHGELVEQAQQNLIMAQSQKPALLVQLKLSNDAGEDKIDTSTISTVGNRSFPHQDFLRKRAKAFLTVHTEQQQQLKE